MTAKEARKLSNKAKDPSTTKGALAVIKRHAITGMSNYPFIFNKAKVANKIAEDLHKLGYVVYWDTISHPENILLEVSW